MRSSFPRHRARAGMALGSAILLCACGGGGSGSGIAGSGGADEVAAGACHAVTQSLTGSGSTTGSTPLDPQLAVDAHFGTYATFAAAAANGEAYLRSSTAQMQAGGSVAGAAFSTPSDGTYTVTITTYLGGAQQENGVAGPAEFGAAGSDQCNAPGLCQKNNGGGIAFFGLATTKTYDSIKVDFSYSAATNPVQVRELCVRTSATTV